MPVLNDELTLVYQPKYRLRDGRIIGAEALVRWNLPDGGVVLPTDFIPIAEESNLIVKLGEWVLDRVCADFRDWHRVMPSPCKQPCSTWRGSSVLHLPQWCFCWLRIKVKVGLS